MQGAKLERWKAAGEIRQMAEGVTKDSMSQACAALGAEDIKNQLDRSVELRDVAALALEN